MKIHTPQGVKNPIFDQRKGLENKEFSNWNPQKGLCPFEEKPSFRGFDDSQTLCEETRLYTAV